ncbi:hypothetical protein K788_0003583 [Paraburkholderia caribensis MBA4]|uniref:Uncharacterized protein n=1 Tax=Paraburkholderia caribensis MBA4 TaxID=1323664 RepID=A0A0P0R625_9BURK|nr:hypothetical protein K788_0003583 [Paraburkholderia caribensis MBA4]
MRRPDVQTESDRQQHEAALCINWSEATPSLKCGEQETG